MKPSFAPHVHVRAVCDERPQTNSDAGAADAQRPRDGGLNTKVAAQRLRRCGDGGRAEARDGGGRPSATALRGRDNPLAARARARRREPPEKLGEHGCLEPPAGSARGWDVVRDGHDVKDVRGGRARARSIATATAAAAAATTRSHERSDHRRRVCKRGCVWEVIHELPRTHDCRSRAAAAAARRRARRMLVREICTDRARERRKYARPVRQVERVR